ncbi:MAG: hypothetical protein HY394_00665 [Candidatus Diapherotrites archaeon]|nr:hypothetical protein [Candidatus Diapherotrites archaeon]
MKSKTILLSLFALFLLVGLSGFAFAQLGAGAGTGLNTRLKVGVGGQAKAEAGANANADVSGKIGGILSPQQREQIREKLNANAEARAQALERIKERAQELQKNISNARQNYLDARQKFLDAKQRLQNQKQGLLEARDEYKNASSDKKAELLVKLKGRAAVSIENQIDAILDKLNALKESGNAPDNVDATIQSLQDLKVSLQDENVSKDDIVAAAKRVREIWQNARDKAQLKAARFFDNKLNSLETRANQAYDNMSKRIDDLEAKGGDVAKLRAALEEFKAHIELVTQIHADLKTRWQEAETAQDKQAVLVEAHRLSVKANRMYVEAFKALKQIVIEYRQLANGEKASATIEVQSASTTSAQIDEELEIEDMQANADVNADTNAEVTE